MYLKTIASLAWWLLGSLDTQGDWNSKLYAKVGGKKLGGGGSHLALPRHTKFPQGKPNLNLNLQPSAAITSPQSPRRFCSLV